MDSVKLLGDYNGNEVYLIKNRIGFSIFYLKKYFILPKFIKEPQSISLIQAVKIINNRLNWEENNKVNKEKIEEKILDA